MNNQISLGFYIPNSDYTFQVEKIICREDFMFIITKENEVIVYQKKLESSGQYVFVRRFLLLTHPQVRKGILDIFLIKLSQSLFNKPSKFIILTISEDLVLNYWNIKDGICINKVKLNQSDVIKRVYTINFRFFVFICKISLIFSFHEISFI